MNLRVKERDIPENHPVRRLFRNLAARALDYSSLSDRHLLLYLSELLVNFIYIDDYYGIRDDTGRPVRYLNDMLQQVSDVPRPEQKLYYQQIGDFSLFTLGMFPESLTYGRRILSRSDYTDTGRRSYRVASELERDVENTVVLRKLSDQFERCVFSLSLIRDYTTDPFYQYMFRQFGIT